MKPVTFLGDSREALRAFPRDARQNAGYQIDRVQRGLQPDDFKPMPTVGMGAEEIRVRVRAGAYRVIYIARRPEAVYVLHAFQKKTRKTPVKDIETAAQRLRGLLKERA